MRFVATFAVLLSFFALASFAMADTVTMNSLSNFWWNDSVTLMGNATYTNGTGIKSESISVVSPKFGCTNTTDESGQYFCTFRAPLEIGTYNATINVTNSTGTSNYNYTNVVVRPKYGQTIIGTTGRSVFEIPFVIQEPSGRIRVITVRITSWRR